MNKTYNLITKSLRHFASLLVWTWRKQLKGYSILNGQAPSSFCLTHPLNKNTLQSPPVISVIYRAFRMVLLEVLVAPQLSVRHFATASATRCPCSSGRKNRPSSTFIISPYLYIRPRGQIRFKSIELTSIQRTRMTAHRSPDHLTVHSEICRAELQPDRRESRGSSTSGLYYVEETKLFPREETCMTLLEWDPHRAISAATLVRGSSQHLVYSPSKSKL